MLNMSLASRAYRLSRIFNCTYDQVIDIREKRFRKLLLFTFRNSPFYKEYYCSHGIHEDQLEYIPVNELPPIDKSLFETNFDRLVTDRSITRNSLNTFLNQAGFKNKERFLSGCTIIHSSGSTGRPTPFVYDRIAWEVILAAAFRACKGDYQLPGIMHKALQGVRVAYIAATEGRFGGVMAANTGISGFGFKPLLLNINRPLDQWIDLLEKFKPNVIIGYPSALKILCDLISRSNIHLEVLRIATAGEPLTRELRDYIQNTLGSDVYNIYGASESLIIGLERNAYQGLYIFDDLNYLETDTGQTYITPLYNYVQPLIRYKLNDRLQPINRNQSEPLPFSKIGPIVGRDEETMWFINENGQSDFLHPLIIYAIYDEGILKYQFIQQTALSLKVLIEIKENADFDKVRRGFLTSLQTILAEKKLNNINVTIEQSYGIPVDPQTGKSKIVIKEILPP